ncbi:type VII secretion protein EccB [Micromonospora sp. NPDC003197]
MPTRRDQMQSYQFIMQRVVSALAYQDIDPVQPTGRRLVGAGLAGIMVAVVGLAAVGVYAMVRPGGSDKWRDGSSIIVERETGTRYVYREGVLHPMANFASALLALGGTPKTTQVSANSLLGIPRGVPLGIVGAPDALPPAGRVTGAAWTTCVQQARDGTGRVATATVLRVGGAPVTGRELGDDALLAEEVDTHRLVLIWRRHRHEIVDRSVVLTALGLDQQPATPVASAWLDTLPAGQRLGSRAVLGRGTPSTAVSGALVGQVYVMNGAGTDRQYYLVADGQRLAPLTAVEASILLADPATRSAYPDGWPVARPLSPAQAAGADKQQPPAPDSGAPPATLPRITAPELPNSAICAEFSDAASPPRLVIAAGQPTPAAPVGGSRRSADGASLADRVEVSPGWAAVVEAVPAPEAPVGTRFLVTDLGLRHALTDHTVQGLLGYANVQPVRLPAALVARVPEGPPLDPSAARRPVQG